MHAAVISGNKLILLLLAQHRAQVGIQDQDLWTPIHYAASFGNAICISILFKQGARLDVLNNANQKPLDVAVEKQQANAVACLRLAQMTIEEGSLNDESFYEALDNFLATLYQDKSS